MVLEVRQEAGGTGQNQGMAQVQLQQIRGQRWGRGVQGPWFWDSPQARCLGAVG